LEDTKIGIPPLHEQKHIADTLSSIDDEIEKESSHNDQLEALKKGLMQVLLTGKIRVKL
jgi:type I restriction enzyme S subunit